MDAEQTIEALQPWVESHQRDAWTPETSPSDGEFTDSKFCGTAWISEDDFWPVCKECGRKLQLMVQLNLDSLSQDLDKPFGSGLLQLFYCTGGDQDGFPECYQEESWEPFSDTASLVRIVQPNGEPSSSSPELREDFPPQLVVGWQHLSDPPDPEDHKQCGLHTEYDFDASTLKMRCPEVGLDETLALSQLEVEDIALSDASDKLGGWPSWVQGAEYPSCPDCGSQMRLVFQLASEDHVPFMFGDCGVGHITQCPNHPEVVAFGWACS